MAKADKIIYTKTDEAPMLATYSFLPIINAFSQGGGCDALNCGTSRWPDASSPCFRNT